MMVLQERFSMSTSYQLGEDAGYHEGFRYQLFYGKRDPGWQDGRRK
jgi:hypothetical protein